VLHENTQGVEIVDDHTVSYRRILVTA